MEWYEDDFLSETLPERWTQWGSYALAHPEELSVRRETQFSGFAFTGLIRPTPSGPRFLVAAYDFTVGQTDPRDQNPIAPPEIVGQVERILAAQRPCGTEVAFLQISSAPRFYHEPWMVVASEPEWIAEQLRSIHGPAVEIEIVVAEEIDWNSQFKHPWFG